MNHRQRSALVKSMDETDFPNKLENLLQSEFARRFPGEVTTSPEVLVLILGYGLFSSGYSLSSSPDQDEFCFYCDARIQVKKNGKTLFEDSIIWHARKEATICPRRGLPVCLNSLPMTANSPVTPSLRRAK